MASHPGGVKTCSNCGADYPYHTYSCAYARLVHPRYVIADPEEGWTAKDEALFGEWCRGTDRSEEKA